MSTEETLKHPPILISNPKKAPERAFRTGSSASHLASVLTTIAAALAGGALLVSPVSVSAFWPFSTSALAASGDTPTVSDATLPLLAAALNSDPSADDSTPSTVMSSDSALVATDGPDGTLPTGVETDPVAAADNDATISTYTVEDGDSISGIAAHFGVSVNTILWANDLTVKSTIKPGDTLVILPVTGVEHTVATGETLSTIATKYDASASEIATFNGLDASATVTVGEKLIIPGGEVGASSASSSSSSSKSSSSRSGTKSTTTTTTKTTSSSSSSSATSGYYKDPVPGAILTQGIHGNNAVDLAIAAGTPIHAAAGGTVIVSKADGAWNGGYGSYVVISHANGTQTLYAHMSKNISSVGDKVAQGDVIGYVGETGEATGNHVHFEVRGAKNPFGYSCVLNKPCY